MTPKHTYTEEQTKIQSAIPLQIDERGMNEGDGYTMITRKKEGLMRCETFPIRPNPNPTRLFPIHLFGHDETHASKAYHTREGGEGNNVKVK